MWHDLRYSVRSLASSRGFSVLAAAELAVGIGLTTALFSVVYAIFFRPLPVHAPEQLVYVYWAPTVLRHPRPMVMGYGHYEVLRDHADVFSGITAHWGVGATLAAGDESAPIRGEGVFSNYFDVLGVKPALGRTLGPHEDDASNPEVAIVISHDAWLRRFRSDPDVLGRQVRLSDWSTTRPATIVGVMGPGFTGVSDPWTPSEFWIGLPQVSEDYRRRGMGLIARLQPGVTRQQAHAVVSALGASLPLPREGARPDTYFVFAANSVRMPYDPSASVAPRRLTLAMSIVVGIVLLVTAANAAGMLLARGVTRRGELAVRLVLGATGRRIARQLILEGMLLSTAAGALGLLLAGWLIQLFRLYTPERFAVAVSLDASAWIFTAALCTVTGALVSVAPAVQSIRLNLTAALPGVAGGTRPAARGRLRYAVVIPQIALSFLLLLVASLHLRTLLSIELVDLGYSPSDAVVVGVSLLPTPDSRARRTDRPSPGAEARHAERARLFYRQLLTRIQAADGSAHVALASSLPVWSHQGRSNHSAISHEAFLAGDAKGPGTELVQVSPGYFRAMNMRLTAGRDFDERDTDRAQKTAIISERLAADVWPGRSAVGRTVAAVSSWNGPNQRIDWLEVVGVVNEVRPILQDNGATPYIYLPMGQQWRPSVGYIVARIAGAPAATVQQLRAAVPAADPFADVSRVQSMDQVAASILYPRRLAGAILGLSAAIALMLASIGLYSVVSYSVAQRRHEIGVRTALGASRADILLMIFSDGIRATAAGAAAGCVLTYAALRLTATLFVDMPGFDMIALVLVPLALAAVVMLACYVPARRALAVDPMDALRSL